MATAMASPKATRGGGHRKGAGMGRHVDAVGEQGHRSEQGAGDDLADHHQGGQRDDPAGSPLMGVVAAAEEDMVVAENRPIQFLHILT